MPSPHPLHVLVAGGGPAAAETVLALREHAGPRVRLTIVAPNFDLVPRVARAAEPFSPVTRHGRSLRALAQQVRAHYHAGRVTAVDTARHEVRLVDKSRLGYDTLVLAVGARPRVVYPTALTLFGQASGAERLGSSPVDLAHVSFGSLYEAWGVFWVMALGGTGALRAPNDALSIAKHIGYGTAVAPFAAAWFAVPMWIIVKVAS